MQIAYWDSFFPFILQKSVAEITPIKSSAWFEFSHLFRFYKANIGKLVHFLSEKGPAIMRCGYSKGPLPTLIKKKKRGNYCVLLCRLWLVRLFTPSDKGRDREDEGSCKW